MIEKDPRALVEPPRSRVSDKFESTTARFLAMAVALGLIISGWHAIVSLTRLRADRAGSLPTGSSLQTSDHKAQNDVDFGPYMAELQRHIKELWFPPNGNESKSVVVFFKIHKHGELSNLRIQRSSGVTMVDQAALKAVTKAAPFRPLPAGAKDNVDVQFTFDYNVF